MRPEGIKPVITGVIAVLIVIVLIWNHASAIDLITCDISPEVQEEMMSIDSSESSFGLKTLLNHIIEQQINLIDNFNDENDFDTVDNYHKDANALIKSANGLGLTIDHPIIQFAQDETTEETVPEAITTNEIETEEVTLDTDIEETDEEETILETEIETIEETEIIIEEPSPVEIDLDYTCAADYIWGRLREAGYNAAIVAGIMGNIMAEVGGQTLNLEVGIYSADGTHYGMCQWSIYYYPEVNGANLAAQCDYLINDIAYQINTFGFLYYQGFNYDAFVQITDVGEAAYAFAKCYERCGSHYYTIRTTNAWTAYNHYVN